MNEDLRVKIEKMAGQMNLVDYKTSEMLRIVRGQDAKISDHEGRIRTAEREITKVKVKQWTIASIFGLAGGAVVNFFNRAFGGE